jgi:hypothetical protein
MSSATSPKPSGEPTASAKTGCEGPAPDTAGTADAAKVDMAEDPKGDVKTDATTGQKTEAATLANAADDDAGSTETDKSSDQSAKGHPQDARVGAGPANEQTAKAQPPETASEAQTETTTQEPSDTDTDGARAEDGDDDAEDEPLDLRALFASSEPEFDSPTDTFERAREAKPEPQSSSAHAASSSAGRPGTQTDEDTELPFDLPADSILDDIASPGDAGELPSSSASDARRHGEATNAFGGAPGDPLADAVQSALRSVYGDENGAQADIHSADDTDAGADGPILQWARTRVADHADHAPGHDEGGNADAHDDEPQDTAAIDAETTEAVLNYLYEHVGSDTTSEIPSLNIQDPADDAFDTSPGEQPLNDQYWGDLTLSPELPAADHAAAYEARQPAARQPVPSAERHNTGAQAPFTSQTETFHPPVDMGAAQPEASGKLLGAAGLGLIGGIAVTGVAAVFVFNSFVTQQYEDTTRQATATTISGQNAAAGEQAGGTTDSAATQAPAEPSETTPRTTTAREQAETENGDAQRTASRGEQAVVAPPQLTSPGENTANARRAVTIDADSVSGTSDQPIPLALSVASGDGDRFLRMTGLPEGVKLSAGVDTGNGSWLLSADRAEQLTLIAPEGFAGVFTLDAQLLSADARTPLSDDVSFRVEVKGAAAAKASETRTLAVDPAKSADVTQPRQSPVQQAERLLRSGDVSGAREILRAETDDNNAAAALALGKSYDPRTFTGLSNPNANPDATQAFRLYQRAAKLGDPNASSQVSELKAWLLR